MYKASEKLYFIGKETRRITGKSFLNLNVKRNVNVVVNFLSQVIFIFRLFLGMATYANEVKTKEKYKLPGIKN